MDFEDPDPSHIVTSIENMQNLQAAWDGTTNRVEEFLLSDTHIPLHASSISMSRLFVDYNFDIDGIVIELNELTAIKSGVNYIFLPERLKVRNHYFLLRKYVDLAAFSAKGRKALQNCCGIVLSHLDGGLYLNLTALPKDKAKPSAVLELKSHYMNIATEALDEIRLSFQDQLRALSEENLKRASVMKQCLSQTAKFEVLPQDLEFILSLLQHAIDQVNDSDEHITVVATITKFGQKQANCFNLDFLHVGEVAGMAVHFGCDVAAKDPDLHLLWSRFGLQQMVGLSCPLYSVLGMHECINVQTPLDGRPVDLKHPILRVLADIPVRFFQMYVPSPHVRYNISVSHPISGLITLCGLQHQQVKVGMLNAANLYMEHLQDVSLKMVGQQGSRLEYVGFFSQTTGIPASIKAEDYFNLPALDSLMQEHPMVVPFMDNRHCKLMEVLKGIMEFISSSLSGLLCESAGKGGFTLAWP